MDDYFLLKKDRLNSFLKAVMRDFCLISPQQANNGDFLFQETQDLDKIALNYDTTSNTLKEFFFPTRETIFRYHKNDSSFKITPVQERNLKTVFFGVRSCDIRAIYFQDKFFAQEPKDYLYWRKRNRGILISLACNKPPRQSCFCLHAHNGGPILEKGEGFDLQFIDLTLEYLVEVGTTKGEGLIKKYRRFFILADEKMQDKKSCLREKCLGQFYKRYDIMNVYQKLKHANLRVLWDDLGKRCTNCGGCEFICPTCFCFYTQDIEYGKAKGERLRAWDSCTFSGYSRMAGEVNPHEKNADRISRRFFCKLYNCYNWFGPSTALVTNGERSRTIGVFGCTGCGRCSFVCPVNLDMQSFIDSLMETNQYQPLLKEL